MTGEPTMKDLKDQYGDVYDFARARGKYTARALFGAHVLLTGDSLAEIHQKVRMHYPGASADLSST
ncbi:MAG TPA: hypothetical protein VMV07_01080 [Streptosporangiaceae bacterium]|nr:hypothetical protein [Streptosporangiaceae bacterium]